MVWPDAHEYVIYIASPTEAGQWEQLAEGLGTAVVWAAAASIFAVLYAPRAAMPEIERSSKRKSKAREEELARQHALALAQANADQAVSVQAGCPASLSISTVALCWVSLDGQAASEDVAQRRFLRWMRAPARRWRRAGGWRWAVVCPSSCTVAPCWASPSTAPSSQVAPAALYGLTARVT